MKHIFGILRDKAQDAMIAFGVFAAGVAARFLFEVVCIIAEAR